MRRDRLPRAVASAQLAADIDPQRYIEQLRRLVGPIAAESEERRLVEIRLRKVRTQLYFLLQHIRPEAAIPLLEKALADQRERIEADEAAPG